jgi:AraC-like DNA-binding protein
MSLLQARVRLLVERLLREKDCGIRRIAAELCMHPRQLQRYLHSEGRSFDTTKDEVRREMALRYLQRPDLSVARVAKLLGYSQSSALSRSCYRWFCASPEKMRERFLL